jgi:diamine N-acetyltransferase
MDIRKAQTKDIPSIQKIAFETWPSAYGDILEQSQIDYMLDLMYNKDILDQQMNESQTFLIIQDCDLDMAFVSFETDYEGQAQTKIHKIYISPAAQGIGLGKILIEETESHALKKRNSKLLLNVNRQNKARFFYEKLGFKIAYTEDIEIGNGYLMNDFVMIKEVKSGGEK